MRHFLLAAAAVALVTSGPVLAQSAAERTAAAALEAAPVWDGHNDVPIQLRSRFGNVIGDFDFSDTLDTQTSERSAMHSDLARLRQGMVGAQEGNLSSYTTLCHPVGIIEKSLRNHPRLATISSLQT